MTGGMAMISQDACMVELPERMAGFVSRVKFDAHALLFFVANERDLIQKQHAAGRVYEEEELRLIARFVRSHSTIVDIGANVGNHAIYFDRVLRAARTIVFEPNPVAANVLVLNALLNRANSIDFSRLRYALGDHPGRAKIVVPWGDNLGAAEVVAEEAGAVPVARGDDVLEDLAVDFIKIDVEGMELAVLRGLENTIRRCRPCMFVEVRDGARPEFDRLVVALGYAVVASYRRYELLENVVIVPQP